MFFRASGDKTTAELAENRSVKARIGQFQSQKILPIDAAADGVSRTVVREVLIELGIGENRPEPVAQEQTGIAMGKGRAGTDCGTSPLTVGWSDMETFGFEPKPL